MVTPRSFADGGGGVLVLVVLSVLIGVSNFGICAEPMPYALPALGAIFLTACLWEAHVRMCKGEVGSFILRVVGNLIFLILVCFIPWIAFVASAHATTCYTPRARVSELILAASSAKTALSEGVQTYGSFAPTWMESITIPAKGQVSYAHVFPDGRIAMIGRNPQAIVVMTPTVTTDNKLMWTCTGEPKKYMPASCRGN